jgi:type IV secretory pathway TrbD component
MARTDTAPERDRRSTNAPADDGLGQPAEVPKEGWRDRTRSKPGVGHAYRVGVFLAGLLCIALGFALAVLPGPLTIPPVLLGLWIWSTEFRFAERFFDSFKSKAKEAWAHAKVHPVSSAAITIGGLAAAGLAMWAVSHYELVAKAKDAIGV